MVLREATKERMVGVGVGGEGQRRHPILDCGSGLFPSSQWVPPLITTLGKIEVMLDMADEQVSRGVDCEVVMMHVTCVGHDSFYDAWLAYPSTKGATMAQEWR